jgi:alcohol dehydrogenase/L-iditol 2-dehydrogenase
LVNYSDAPHSVELREWEKPVPEAGQVLIRVGATGVCGSDIHTWKGPVSWTINRPIILGHEYAGTIEELGPGVSGWKVGDRVTGETAAEVCGSCVYCKTGNYNLCPERKGFGALYNGSMAEYIRVRHGILHHIPEGISFEEAALTEPAAVGFNAVYVKSKIIPGDTVVVIGPGTIGLMALQMARQAGPAALVMVGLTRDQARLELAESMGADLIVRADKEDPVAAVMGLGDRLGADLVIDAVGLKTTIRQSQAMIRPNGQITKIGWDANPYSESLDPLVAKAVTFQGSFSHTWPSWERVLRLMALKRVDTKSMFRAFDLEDWERGFSQMDDLSIAKAVLIP